jgi:hypothetical protein
MLSLWVLDFGPTDHHDRSTELRVWGKDAMVSVSVHARRWDEEREPLER